MSVAIVVGLQWGDEGKGKVVDLLSEKSDIIVRSQGGGNAGHSIKIGDQEYKFHLIPSGILHENTTCVLGGNVALDPEVLFRELDLLESLGISWRGRFFVSLHAPVVFDYHKFQDQMEEKRRGASQIGSTKMGIGPLYADKAGRLAIRVCDLVDKKNLKDKLKKALLLKNELFEKIYGCKGLDLEVMSEKYLLLGERLKPYAVQTEIFIAEMILKENKKVLLEGAQGALLDCTFGTYPYVTSSCTLASGVVSGAGIGMNRVKKVLGVVKAYSTRVGAGPMPTELGSEERKLFSSCEKLREVGTTTGRARRIGWLDLPMLRYASLLDGATSLAVMKLDILSSFDKIKFCTFYELDGKKLKYPPASCEDLQRVTPIYEELPGWKKEIGEVRDFHDLPENARRYLYRLKSEVHLPLELISVGPERESSIWIGDDHN